MKVLLICPSQTDLYGGLKPPEHPHIGLAYIAAVLEEAGHEVRLLDMDADAVTRDKLTEILRDSPPGLVGITATTPVIKKAIQIAETVKEFTSAKTVLGGVHPTLRPEETAAHEAVDFVVRGEGEATTLELVEAIEHKRDLSGVRGLVFKEGGKVIVNQVRELIGDLDALAFPALGLFRNQSYTYPDALMHPTFPIVTSRGCPAKCTYCNTKNLHGRGFRYRSAKNVVDEIEGLIDDFGAREIHFWDDNFTTNKKRVFEIRDEILRRGIKTLFAFPNGIRVDYVNTEILGALKEMGCYSIAFGVESGSQRVLDRVQKGTTLKRVEEAFASAREAGLEIWAFFMLGLPGEDETTIMETIRFAKKLDPDIAKFHLMVPYPGTEVHDELLSEGLITDIEYENYGIHTRPVHRLPTLSEDDLLKWQKRAYRQFYLRPGKLASQLLRLKSWNRVKLNVVTGATILRKMVS